MPKDKKKSNKPKTGYNLYFQDEYPKLSNGTTISDASKIIGAQWKALDDSEKQVYLDSAKQLRLEYEEKHGKKPHATHK